MSATDQDLSGGTDPGNDWKQVQESPDFTQLRHRLRTFVFPMTILFLAWYLVYVLLADYAPKFMATKIAGNFNVGLLIGLLQFVSTFVITAIYVRYANRKLDPIADKIRAEVEGDTYTAQAVTPEPAPEPEEPADDAPEAEAETPETPETPEPEAAEEPEAEQAESDKAEDDASEDEKTKDAEAKDEKTEGGKAEDEKAEGEGEKKTSPAPKAEAEGDAE